jgi:hypothetical protein
LIAQGYKKITSTSNNTKRIATKKYFTENGIRAFPTDSIPLSKLFYLFTEALFGPSFPEIIIVPTTNPTASSICINIGK